MSDEKLKKFLSVCQPIGSMDSSLFNGLRLQGNDLIRFNFLRQHYPDYLGIWSSFNGDFLNTALRGFYYVIPLYSYSGNLYGVYLRNIFSEIREHHVYSLYDTFTLYMYSLWDRFQNYTAGSTIIVCEGILDALYLQVFHPYVISFCGVGINEERMFILSNVGYNYLLFNDNDTGGEKANKRFESYSTKYHLMYRIFDYPNMEGLKDPFSFLYQGLDMRMYLQTYLING